MTERLTRSAWVGSTTVRTMRVAIAGSVLLRSARALAATGAGAIPWSRLDRAFDHSVVVRHEREAEAIARWSAVNGWLGAEPDDDVIVVDVREAYTAGTVVSVVETALSWLGVLWLSTPLARPRSVLFELSEAASSSRTVRLVVKLVEPPEGQSNRERR